VEQLGAGSGTEGVQALSEAALEIGGSHCRSLRRHEASPCRMYGSGDQRHATVRDQPGLRGALSADRKEANRTWIERRTPPHRAVRRPAATYPEAASPTSVIATTMTST
jgi:hypothetical protein